MNKFYIIGAGPGSEEYLLPAAKKKIKQAEVLLGGQRLLDTFGQSYQQKIEITADLNYLCKYIKNNYQKQKIAVLVSGDPGLYSILKYLKKFFYKKEIKVIPGISSFQLAFAHNKMVWQDAEIISLHGRDNRQKLLAKLKTKDKIALFTDRENTPDKIAEFLWNNQIQNKRILVCEKLSYPEEEIFRGSIKETKNKNFGSLTVMVIYNE